MGWEAFAANMGNNLMALQDREQANKMQAAQLAAAEQANTLRGLQINQAKQADADATQARTRKDAYGAVLMDSTDQLDYLKKKADKAKEMKDSEGFASAVNELAAARQKQFSDQMNQGLRHFMVSGDPTVLQDRFNAVSPGIKVAFTPGQTPGQYTLTTTTPDGKQSQPQTVGKNEIGMMTMMAMDPKFAETIFKEQAKADLELKKEDRKGQIKLNYDNAHQGFVFDRQEKLAGINQTNTLAQIAARGIQDRSTGASNAAAQGAQQRQTYTWKSATDAAMGGEGGLDVKEQDKRVEMMKRIVNDSMKQNALGGMDPSQSPIFREIVDRGGKEVRAGRMTPEEAANQIAIAVTKEADARKKADMASPGGAKGLPIKPTATLPSF